jgi:hypothetical protein
MEQDEKERNERAWEKAKGNKPMEVDKLATKDLALE